MSFVHVRDIREMEPVPGFHGRFAHSSQMTLAHWTIDEGAVAPEHRHPHEQICHVIEGSFELTLDGETRVLEPGSIALIAPDVPHGGRAITACRLLDIFHPSREDWR